MSLKRMIFPTGPDAIKCTEDIELPVLSHTRAIFNGKQSYDRTMELVSFYNVLAREGSDAFL